MPTHCAFTAGPMRDRLFLKYDGTPERFQRAVAHYAPATSVRVLAPGEPLALDGRARQPTPPHRLLPGAGPFTATRPGLSRC